MGKNKWLEDISSLPAILLMEQVDLKQLEIVGRKQAEILEELKLIYIK